MVLAIESVDHFNTTLSNNSLVAAIFWAEWSQPSTHLISVAQELLKTLTNLTIVKVEAEQLSELSEKFNVESVPITIIFKDGVEVDRIVGSSAPDFTRVLTSYGKGEDPDKVDEKKILFDRLKKLINSDKIMVFIKGTKTQPQCGFTKQILDILNGMNVEYSTFNILESPEVRQGLKEYSNWPTYPQLYVKGELIGGLDIVKELKEEGELEAILKA